MDWSLYPNFKRKEFECHEHGECIMHPQFMNLLQEIRENYGKPMIISSGYRCRNHSLESKRPWFLCPALGCNRRVAILYGGAIFACRHCYKLAYKSQSETNVNRATRRADKIRDNLKWEPGILNGEGLKPKGMHWRIFERLYNQHQQLVDYALLDYQRRFGTCLDLSFYDV